MRGAVLQGRVSRREVLGVVVLMALLIAQLAR